MIMNEADRCLFTLFSQSIPDKNHTNIGIYRGKIVSVIAEDEIVLEVNPPYSELSKNAEGIIYIKKLGTRFYAKGKFIFVSEKETIVKIPQIQP